MKITVKQLAQQLNLDHSTVAYALSGKGRISPQTRQRVREAAQRLGYVPNRLARGMRAGRTNTVGLILTDVVHSPYGEVVQHLLKMVSDSGRELLIALHQFDPRLEEQGVRRMLESQVEGLLVKATRPTWDDFAPDHPLRQAVSRGLPVVLYYTQPNDALGLPTVSDPRVRSFAIALEHLADLGHRRIAALFPVPALRDLSMLLKAAADGIAAERMLAVEYVCMPTASGNMPEYISQHNPEHALAMGRELFARALSLQPRPTAMICFNDVIATGAVTAALARGMRVPQDISISGCYRVPSSFFSPVPLTTCDTRPAEYAREMLSLLESRIAAPSAKVLPREVVPVLVPGASTGRIHESQPTANVSRPVTTGELP